MYTWTSPTVAKMNLIDVQECGAIPHAVVLVWLITYNYFNNFDQIQQNMNDRSTLLHKFPLQK